MSIEENISLTSMSLDIISQHLGTIAQQLTIMNERTNRLDDIDAVMDATSSMILSKKKFTVETLKPEIIPPSQETIDNTVKGLTEAIVPKPLKSSGDHTVSPAEATPSSQSAPTVVPPPPTNSVPPVPTAPSTSTSPTTNSIAGVTAPPMTATELNEALQAEAARLGDGGAAIFSILSEMGADAISDIKAEHYHILLTRVRAL